MRVACVIHGLAMGGAERVLVTLANHWVACNWQVTILTLDGGGRSFFALDPRVEHHALGLAAPARHALHALAANIGRIATLRRALITSHAQVVIAFMAQTNVMTLCAAVGLGVPVVVTEHSEPMEARLPWPWPLLCRLTYPLASRVVVPQPAILRPFGRLVRRRAQVLPPPVVVAPGRAGNDAGSARGQTIIAMGRLVAVKGFDRLIRAWSVIARIHPNWQLEIWGEGPERAALEALILRLNLQGRVLLPGVAHEPFRLMERAGVVVVASHHESFSLVLAEAMACGTAVVSFDCPSGPRHLIRHGINGLLVPAGDVDALAQTLDRLLTDNVARRELAARGPEVLDRVGLPVVAARWAALLAELVRL